MNTEIRTWRTDDATSLASALNNKKIQDNLRDGIPYPYTITDAEAFINIMINGETDNQYAWAITVDDKAIGSIGVFRKDNIHSRTAEMGYYIAEPYWGKGIGTKAVKYACDYVFEGTLRKNAVKHGKVINMQMYSLVKD